MASAVQVSQRGARTAGEAPHVAGMAMIVMGMALVAVGALMLAFLGMTVVEMLKAPEETKLVSLILEQTQAEGQAFFGQFGTSSVTFTIGEPLRTMLFVLILVWILQAVLKIVTAIVGAGRDLVTAGRQR
jgi:type IV secretory pathway VirB3-like protein